MPEETSPRRRRNRQVIPPEPQPERTPDPQPELPPEPPRRIVIDQNDETPEWMVSAGKISGAASRRTQRSTEPAHPASPKSAGRTASSKTGSRPAVKAPATKASAPKASATKPRSAYVSAKSGASAAPRKPAPAQKPRKLSKKAKQRRLQAIRRSVIGLLAAAVCVTLIVVGAMAGSRLLDIKRTLDRGDGVFYPNIFVNNIPLEGKTLDEAAAAVTDQVMSLISSWKITLRTVDGRTWDITGEDLKMKYDVADQLDQLWAIGHTGSSSSRYEQVKALEEEPAMRYTTLSYDMSMVTQILNQVKSEVDQPAVNATRVDDDTQWPPFSYTDDVPGMELDVTGLNEKICAMVDMLESGTIDLTPTRVQATVTRAYLESQIVQLGTYATSIGKTGDYVENRHENIRIGTERFDRLIIKAGESVSFNKVTGKRSDPSNGYKTALEISYGNYVEGLGGGICQVSSTLYNAVVNAGLQVTQRTPHSIPSTYVPKGQDATVSDDRLDFVFKNNTGADIYIEASYYQAKNNYYYTSFTIYGRPDPNGYTYKMDSVVRETIPLPEPEYKQDKDGQYVIYVDDDPYVYSKGREGYIVDVYIVTMDSNGLEISRELDHTDTYTAAAPVYYVGVTARETPIPESVD